MGKIKNLSLRKTIVLYMIISLIISFYLSALIMRIASTVPLYITKRSETVLQWGKRKNIKKMMINGELVIEWKKEKSIKDVVVEKICYD